MGRSKNAQPVKKFTIETDHLIHAAITGVFIFVDLFRSSGYTGPKADEKILKLTTDPLTKMMVTEYVNATVRIMNIVIDQQKKVAEDKKDVPL